MSSRSQGDRPSTILGRTDDAEDALVSLRSKLGLIPVNIQVSGGSGDDIPDGYERVTRRVIRTRQIADSFDGPDY